MYDCIKSIDKQDDDEFKLHKPLSQHDKKELQEDLKKVTHLLAEKSDFLSEVKGTVAINIRTTSNRYFDIIFNWRLDSDEEIVVNYERLREADLDEYLDSINRNKLAPGDKININDV